MNQIDIISSAMLDKKAKNVCSLNFKKIGTAIADYFVICNADSSTAVAAIADNVEEMMYKNGIKAVRTQGKENGFWVIIDFVDIVVHIFKTEYRDFYRLEDLWADAEIKKYAEVHDIDGTKKVTE
ncbi:MAG: ribosome silencing factor [Bacteroidales bacterium]